MPWVGTTAVRGHLAHAGWRWVKAQLCRAPESKTWFLMSHFIDRSIQLGMEHPGVIPAAGVFIALPLHSLRLTAC